MLDEIDVPWRRFRADVEHVAAPGQLVSGAVIRIGNGRTSVRGLVIRIEGEEPAGLVHRELVKRNSDTTGDQVATLTWDPVDIHPAGARAIGPEIELTSEYQGANPASAEVVWLGPDGDPFDTRFGLLDEGQVIRSEDAELVAEWLNTDFQRVMSVRLQLVAQCTDLRVRRGAAFFHDLDSMTYPSLLQDEAAKAMQFRVREALFVEAKNRARLRLGFDEEQPDANRRDRLQRMTVPYRKLFERLTQIHFGFDESMYATNALLAFDYDREMAFTAVRGFALGEHPVYQIAGVPDSPYYFCFAELMILFGEQDAFQRAYWIHML